MISWVFGLREREKLKLEGEGQGCRDPWKERKSVVCSVGCGVGEVGSVMYIYIYR